jgi:hypothetical protein
MGTRPAITFKMEALTLGATDLSRFNAFSIISVGNKNG